MNKALPITKKQPKKEHGTVTSYVMGFILSLVFTVIPYYLVVRKSFDKNALIVAILGFAVLQMVIQVFFFLHLGREKKPRWNLFFLVSTIGIILLVVVGSIWIMNHLHHHMSGMDVTDKIAADEGVYEINGQQAGTCPGGTGTNHKILLKNNAVQPRHSDAHLCDTLTIMNLDNSERMIMFGSNPDHHESYAGQTGETIRPGRNMVITLTELGTHGFHDHMMDELSGDFTVTP